VYAAAAAKSLKSCPTLCDPIDGSPLNRQEFKQTPVNSEGQGSMACCNPWGCKESDMTATEQLNYATITRIKIYQKKVM